MLNLIKDAASSNGLTVRDFIEVRKLSMIPHLPNAGSVRQIWTMYALCSRYLDLLKSRYGDLERAIAIGEKGGAFVAQAIQKRDNPLGGVCGWIKKHFRKAAFSHPTVMQARDRMVAMGVVAYDSNGRGNVGYTRINVPDMLILMALLEDVLGITPESGSTIGDEQLSPEFWAEYEAPDNPVPAIAKVNRSRWQRFFGCNPRASADEYRYPHELEAVAVKAWAAIASVAKPVTTIPAQLVAETTKYCIERSKFVITKGRWLERTLKVEREYQADLDAMGAW